MLPFLQRRGITNDDGTRKSLDELRDLDRGGSFLDTALFAMSDGYSFEECFDAFTRHPLKEECSVDDLIRDFSMGDDGEGIDLETDRDRQKVCLFAGIARALLDLKSYREGLVNNTPTSDAATKERNKRDSEGHLIYEEEEPEMHHGWSGSWAVDEDKPKKNDIFTVANWVLFCTSPRFRQRRW